jgi:pimeloyl-ACP methyl ester carboxylesterase
VEIPGRGTTRVWECRGPAGAETLVLIHGVTLTAELNWGRVLEPLGRHFRVVALDQRGHGLGLKAGPQFRLEDCADDVAALAGALGIGRFVVAGYSMGGLVAQLVYRRHPSLVSGLVLCATAREVHEPSTTNFAALTLPLIAATMRWIPTVQVLDAGVLGAVLLGSIDDAETRLWARRQLRRTSLTTAISAIQAVCAFTSKHWIGEVKVPTAVVVTTRDRIVSVSRQRELAGAIPGAVTFDVEADHGVCVNAPQLFAGVLLEACQSVQEAARRQLLPQPRSAILPAEVPAEVPDGQRSAPQGETPTRDHGFRAMTSSRTVGRIKAPRARRPKRLASGHLLPPSGRRR